MRMIEPQDPMSQQYVPLSTASRMRTRLRALAHVLETSRLTMLREGSGAVKVPVGNEQGLSCLLQNNLLKQAEGEIRLTKAGPHTAPHDKRSELSADQINALAHDLGLTPQTFHQMIAASH